MGQCCSSFWGCSWPGQVSPRSWLGWIPVLHPGCQVSGVVKGGKAATSPSCKKHYRDVTTVGPWGRAGAGPFSSPPHSGSVCGETLPAPACQWARRDWLCSGSHSSFSGQVLMVADGDSAGFLYRQLPFLASLERKDGKATAYICSNFTCSLPVTSVQELRGMLRP